MNAEMLDRRRFSALAIFGGAVWIVIGVVSVVTYWQFRSDNPVAIKLVRYVVGGSDVVDLAVPEGQQVQLRYGDPIFARSPDGDWQQVGHFVSIAETNGSVVAKARWYDSRAVEQFEFEYCRNRGTLAEAVQILLPEQRRQAILNRIAEVQRAHGAEIAAAFRPVLEKTLRDSVPVIESGITNALSRHRGELEAVGKRYESELVGQRLVPLVRSEILPVVRTHGEPLAKDIGLELWDRASLFRFGWRMVYDKSPLPQRHLTNQEWDRFVEKEAVPVFEAHIDEMVDALKDMLREMAANPKVRDEFRGVLKEVISDPELQNVFTSVLREGIVENQDLRQVWQDNWQTGQAKAAIQLASDRLEPVVREIGDEIFGTRDGGVSPGFARVLRNQILGKDRHWVEAHTLEDDSIQRELPRLVIANDVRPFPFLYLANDASFEPPQ